MKKTLFAAFALFALLSAACTKTNDQVLVRFQNTLSQDITEAVMTFDDTHSTAVGLISAGAATDYIAFDYFETGDGWPTGYLNGKKGDEDFSAWSGLFCGTGVTFKQLEPGSYTLEILEFEYEGGKFYQIKFVE